MADTYRIDEVKVSQPLSKDTELIHSEEVLFNFEKRYSLKFGFPMNWFGEIDQGVMDSLSGPPYVFMAHHLIVIDPSHPNGVDLENVPTIFMHGGRINGVWCFSDPSQPVADYLKELDKYFLDNGYPLVKFILACNDDGGIKVHSEEGWTIHEPEGINILDIDHTDLAYVAGDVMNLSHITKFDLENGQISVKVRSGSDILGLNKLLETHSAVKII